jgi:uncharacterized surface protein with fasciclin (FAS1) repeats
MSRSLRLAIMGLVLVLPAAAIADQEPVVGGHVMHATKDVTRNMDNSDDHTTFTRALRQARLMRALTDYGPFTIFAPTNEAFAALPAGTMDTLMKDDARDQLNHILQYHVVRGDYDLAKLAQMAKDGGGTATLPTMQGDKLTIVANKDGSVSIKDAKGGIAKITIPDIKCENGRFDVIDKVLMP